MVVRADLSHSQRAVQACHALASLTAEAMKRKDKVFKHWVENERTLVLLKADDEKALKSIHRKVDAAGIIHNVAEEPDWVGGPQVTALAIYPHEQSILQSVLGELRLL